MDRIDVFCESVGQMVACAPGESLMDLSKRVDTGCKFPVVAALVDNMLKELSFKIYTSHTVQFLDYTHSDGRRTYNRSLSMVLQKAVVDLFPEYQLFLEYNLPNGLYGVLRKKGEDKSSEPITLKAEHVQAIKARMSEIIAGNFPIVKTKTLNPQACEIFKENGQLQKSRLVSNMEKFFVSVYSIDGYSDTFYGPMLERTSQIDVFDLIPYSGGFCLQSPSMSNPMLVAGYKYQDKLSSVFKENSRWCAILGANGISAVNQAIRMGRAKDMIAIAEALHERKYAEIADKIYQRRDSVKLVLIAGPSSSGKTTTSKRIALQCKVLGLNPKVIAMDDYFVDREHTPRDEKGEYDFESIYAMDLDFLGKQLNDLFQGKEVELPKFDFIQGKRVSSGVFMKLQESDVLIMEGIHALNPELTKHIETEKVFRVYASALTTLSIDENNAISTADTRMLRRMVRDNLTRGIVPEQTILRWQSVRAGEEKNIFPYQENADVMFNSSILFELPLLKYYAEPLLKKIPPLSKAYAESVRMLKFLSLVLPLDPADVAHIPPTSVMREFIGGSTFTY